MIFPPGSSLPERAGICIVGSGPVGLALSYAFAQRGMSSVLLESGTARVDARVQELAEAERVSSSHAPMRLAVVRGIGGTSRTWGGRCVPFGDGDFASPPVGGGPGWQIAHEEVGRFYDEACRFLAAGSASFRANDADDTPAGAHGVEWSSLERWSSTPDMRKHHRRWLDESGLVHLYPDATVVGFERGDGGRLKRAVIRSESGSTATLAVGTVILACGGLENARQLLSLQEDWPSIAGGRGGALGKYYMGHLSGKIADMVFVSGEMARRFDYLRDGTGTYVRRRLTLGDSVRREHDIMNIAFYPDNPPIADPRHGSALLSLVWLALSLPGIGALILPEAIRLANVGTERRVARRHLANVVRGLPQALTAMPGLFVDRVLARPRKPGVHLEMPGGRHALHYHGEHAPNALSHVTLSSARDRAGMRRLVITLQYSERDAVSVVRAHDRLDEGLRHAGIGRVEHWFAPEERVVRVLERAADGYHQIGLTRMARDASDGAVDTDCRVHGIGNLFVAGSSVFPTSGEANPTLLAVALSFRLAEFVSELGDL